MDTKEIKRQLAYMEELEAGLTEDIKTLSARQKIVKDTIKNLKSLLPKEKTNVVESRSEEAGETVPQ